MGDFGTAFGQGLRAKRDLAYVDQVADDGVALMELAGYDQEAQVIRERMGRGA